MAITTPYGLELARNDDARDVVADALPAPSAGKLKIYLGANIDPAKRQSIHGTLTLMFNALMAEHLRSYSGSGTCSVYAPVGATVMDVTIEKTGIMGITDDDVAIVVAGNFLDAAHKAATHFYEETFEQLLEVLLENTKDN